MGVRSGRQYHSLLGRRGQASSAKRKSFVLSWRQKAASVLGLSSYGRIPDDFFRSRAVTVATDTQEKNLMSVDIRYLFKRS